jgi:hypothetical protein
MFWLVRSPVAMALLAVVAAWLVFRSTKLKASVPSGPDGSTLRFPAALARRFAVLAGIGAGVGLLASTLGITYGIGCFAFPAVMLGIRYWVGRYTLRLDRTRLYHDQLWGGTRTLQWVRLSTVRLAGPWLVITDEDGARIQVSRFLDGLGALALHIDDCASSTLQIDDPTRSFLLDCYRRGLLEANENPDLWLAKRSGPLTRQLQSASPPDSTSRASANTQAAPAQRQATPAAVSSPQRPSTGLAGPRATAKPDVGSSSAVRYDIVIDGLAPGADRATAIRTLAQAFRVPEDRIARLVSGGRAVVKKGVEESSLKRYLGVLRGAGVQAEAEALAKPSDPPIEVAAAPPSGAPLAEAAEMPTPAPAQALGLEEFLQWAARANIPRAATPLFREAAKTLLEAAGAARVSPAIADAVVWQEESRGAPEVRLQALRKAGEALVRFENEVEPSAKAAGSASAVGHRPTIEAVRQLIGRCIVRSERTAAPSPPRIAQCRRVMEVAPLCPASELGVRRGDLVVSIDVEPAALRAVDNLCAACDWELYLASSKELVRATTNGVPLGIRLGPTGEAMKAGVRSDSADVLALWDMGEYQILHDRCRAVVAADRDCPEYVLLGAALMELGRSDEGFGIIVDFLDHYAQRWVSEYTGVGLYYVALSKLKSERDSAAEIALAAYRSYKCQAIVDLVEHLTGDRLPLRPNVYSDRPFTARYELSTEDGNTRVALARTLEQMPSGQLLAVCALGGYRANGPYSVFMKDYAQYVSALPSVFHSLHVVTAGTDAGHEAWLAGERAARKRGTRFVVLHDPEDTVMSAIRATGSPTVLAIDKQCVIRGENIADEIGMWQALASFAVGRGDV